MATRTIHRLKGTAVTGKRAKPGRYPDGGGLYLQVGPTGTKAWLYRFMLNGKAREMGLGAVDVVDVGTARAEAQECRKLVHKGIDPIEARRAGRLQSLIEASRNVTFKECAEAYIEAHRAGWKNAKHAAQWTATLETYCMPTLGKLPVSGIDTGLVLKVLEGDFWLTKTETATRVRGRIEKILDWAIARGYREGTNPARWQGHLDKMLPKPSKVKTVTHHAALHFDSLPAFFRKLSDDTSGAARALQLIILTATRTSETLNARWSEIDVAKKTWTIPADRMKAEVEHRVPLTDASLSIIKAQREVTQNEFVFAGAKPKMPLSNMACLALLRRMKRTDLTVHGFRSTFRDWAAEKTNFPRDVAEMALAHTIKDNVEAAYRRGDLLEKRRVMMAQWADYCGGKFTGKVQAIGTGKKTRAA